jgi:hypothetical protein
MEKEDSAQWLRLHGSTLAAGMIAVRGVGSFLLSIKAIR